MARSTDRERRRIAALLASRERRGLSWSELSRSSGLSLNQLFYWRRQLASERIPPRPRRRARRAVFVPVEVVGGETRSGAIVEITTPSGFQLRVPPEISSDDPRRIVEALAPAC